MSLRFSPTGVAVYGVGSVAVDGSVPAALTGTVGPAAWQTTGILVYQDGGTGSGPWTFKRLTLPATIANIDSNPASVIRGGGNEWAAWEPATGLRTSVGVGPFAGSLLGDVSPDGEVVRIDSGAGGLTVYDDAGSTIYTAPAVILHSHQVCLRDSHLSYYDTTGWHLIDISTGEPANWYPRTDGVNWLVPVTHQGTLYVLERSPSGLTLRPANKNKGWILSTDPNAYSPDAESVGSFIYAGACTNGAESAASLVVYKVTATNAANVSVQTGTIVAGAIVYGSATTISPLPFTVGPLEGNSLVSSSKLPVTHQVINDKGLMTKPWLTHFERVEVSGMTTAEVVQKLPTPQLNLTAYDHIASTGQPTMQAQQGMTTLNLETLSGSGITLNPATNTITLDALGVSYVPVSTGAEPLVIMSNGAGAVLLTPYTP